MFGDGLTVQAEAECPYCHYRNPIYIDSPEQIRSPWIILCDCENGPGCGRYFVINCYVQATVEEYAIDW